MHKVHQLVDPRLALICVGRQHRGPHEGREAAIVIGIPLGAVGLPDGRIGDDHIGVAGTGKIERLAKTGTDDTVVQRVRNGGIGNHQTGLPHMLGKDLVRHHQHMVLLGQSRHSLQILPLPYIHSGVMRVTEEHQFVFRCGHFLLQVGKVHLIPVTPQLQGTVH